MAEPVHGEKEDSDWVLERSVHGDRHSLSGLSLRAGGWEFSPAIMNMSPGYFHGKIEPKELPKKKIYIEKERTITIHVNNINTIKIHL